MVSVVGIIVYFAIDDFACGIWNFGLSCLECLHTFDPPVILAIAQPNQPDNYLHQQELR